MGKGAFLYRTFKVLLSPGLKRAFHVETEGLENVPADGPVILAANHGSFMDSVWVPLTVPRRVVYLAKGEYFDSWKTAWFFRGLGMIPVDRSSKHAAHGALASAEKLLLDGGVLGVYPEGTRSLDGRLYRGRTGVARLVLRSGAPVVPIGLVGSREIMPKGAKAPKFGGRATVRFGAPLRFEKYRGVEEGAVAVRAITDEIMYQIMSLSGQEYVDQYASTRAAQVAPEDYRLPSDEMLG